MAPHGVIRCSASDKAKDPLLYNATTLPNLAGYPVLNRQILQSYRRRKWLRVSRRNEQDRLVVRSLRDPMRWKVGNSCCSQRYTV